MSDPAEELYEAARDGDNAKVDALISEHGINVQDGDGDTALHKAAINTNIAATKLLLMRDADVTVTDNWKHTQLYIAAYNGHLEITKWLLAFGSDPQAKNKDNETAKDRAKKQGHHEVASLLEKVEAMKDVFPLAKNSLGAFSLLNDAENLQKTLANQSGKKASDNFVFNLQLVYC